jgi:Protein of unknown function (DUF433)
MLGLNYGCCRSSRSYRCRTREDGWQPRDQGPSRHAFLMLTMLAKGASREAVLEAYPVLESADIDACLLYAARLSELAAAEGLTIAAE